MSSSNRHHKMNDIEDDEFPYEMMQSLHMFGDGPIPLPGPEGNVR